MSAPFPASAGAEQIRQMYLLSLKIKQCHEVEETDADDQLYERYV